mmetsp:Transcript_55452/g.118976  ORF Transcript_55452/g.118976 Transcript_55452/m.118976 type:complete len:391 (-) Transcript_55452:438-1610(-)
MVIGGEAGQPSLLYIADPGQGRVLAVDPKSGQFSRSALCVPAECFPAHDEYVEGTCVDGYCSKGACMNEDGYGCHHIITETADSFEYELWNCTAQLVLSTEVPRPSGIAYAWGHVFVGDFDSGKIFILNRQTGALVQEFDTGTGSGLVGLDIVAGTTTANLYFVNMKSNQTGVVQFPKPSTVPEPATVVAPACNAQGNTSRPRFYETHGPGYNDPMIIHPAFGKDCTSKGATRYVRTENGVQELVDGYQPGTVPANDQGEEWTRSELMECDMRTDCERYTGPGAMNADAILMAGYLCHPCVPDPCGEYGPCSDLFHLGKPGFSCANADAYVVSTATTTQADGGDGGSTTTTGDNANTTVSTGMSGASSVGGVVALALVCVCGGSCSGSGL